MTLLWPARKDSMCTLAQPIAVSDSKKQTAVLSSVLQTHLWPHGSHQVQSRWPAPAARAPAAQTHCALCDSPRCGLHGRAVHTAPSSHVSTRAVSSVQAWWQCHAHLAAVVHVLA